MKIMMLSNTYLPIMGGLERSIASFTMALRQRGHQVVVVAPEFENMPENEEDVVRLPALKNVGNTQFSVAFPMPEALSQKLKIFQPDIVHTHHPFIVGDLGFRLAEQYGIPLVFTYHTMFEWYSDFGLKNDVIEAFVLKLAAGYANMADYLIAPSQSIRRILKRRGIETPISIVPTGVDVDMFAKGDGTGFRRRHKIPSDVFVVGHLGRLDPEKNLNFLVNSVIQFLKKDKKTYFLLAGKGKSEKEIQHLFVKAGLSKRMVIAGPLEGKELVDAYHAMDLFAFASQSETQGMVVTEAMAAGLPVVALDGPGVREVVHNSENGRLLSEEEEALFAKALLWCRSRPEKVWQEMKKEAIKTAQEFSIAKCTDALEEVYKVTQRDFVKKNGQDEYYRGLMGRMKAEWELLLNLGAAAGKALRESITTNAGT